MTLNEAIDCLETWEQLPYADDLTDQELTLAAFTYDGKEFYLLMRLEGADVREFATTQQFQDDHQDLIAQLIR